MIPYGRQDISQEDIDAVVSALKSDWLTQGPAVPEFEGALAAYCGVEHAIAVNSATSALHIACMALGLEAGDWLWTSPITFVASANAALYCGASVDFVDIDPVSYNLSVSALAQKLARAEKNGRLPKVLVPVHFAGQPCAMREIRQLADQYGFRIIEDASHAVGASYLDGKVGNCEYSDISVFSFHPVKIITSGEGGMAVTRSAELADAMRSLRSHGITRDHQQMVRQPEGPWYYEQVGLGYNYRITDIQAALGRSQLQRIDGFIARRHEIADAYDRELATLPLILPVRHKDSYSALHLYPVQLRDDTGKTRQQLFDGLRARGIGVNVHYIPVHTQPYYEAMGFKQGDFPEAERYYSRAVSLPMYSSLTPDDFATVVAALRSVLS